MKRHGASASKLSGSARAGTTISLSNFALESESRGRGAGADRRSVCDTATALCSVSPTRRLFSGGGFLFFFPRRFFSRVSLLFPLLSIEVFHVHVFFVVSFFNGASSAAWD